MFALAGCVPLGPDFQTPTHELTDSWQQPLSEGLSMDGDTDAAWWHYFGDPTLDQLVEHARQGNYSLRAAGLNVIAARAQLGIAVGSRYPQVQQVSGNRTVIDASKANANTASGADLEYTQYGVAFEAGWELDFWGRFQRGIEAADASMSAAIADYDNALILLIAQVATTYTAYRSTEEELRIARENLVLQQRSYDIADILFRNGENSELDMQQARTLLLSTESTIPSIETRLRQQRNALQVLLGDSNLDIDTLLATEAVIPVAPEQIAVGIPADLLRKRPDVRAAENLAKAQSARIGIAEADLYPSIALTGSIGLQSAGNTSSTATGDSGFDALFDRDAVTYGFGPSFNWKILNYGRLRNNVRVQDARLQQALANYHNTLLRAGAEVEDAIAAYIGARQSERILARVVTAARRSSDLALLQYREGLADYQRVLDSQQALFAQQQRHLSALTLSTTSLIGLYKALGGGWQVREGNAFVDQETINTMSERSDWGDLLTPGAIDPETPPSQRSPDN